MIGDPIPLGPFVLHARVGQGGMGEVWRGVHRATNVPVAVKLLRQSARGHFAGSLRNEVHHVARLNHPGIVMLLDWGEVDVATEAESRGQFAAGGAWLAMEYASGGSLDQMHRSLTWDEIRNVLLAVLDALAHAHARGVLHRDIKPANILVSGPVDPRPGLKLTDFGISQAIYDTPDADLLELSTPEYAAPEQARARWRDQGPWTDLYAVGCVAWRLVTGRVPFTAPSRGDIAAQHLGALLPPLEPRIAVPPALAAWLAQLLAKRPEDRFRIAAHAAAALAALGEPPPDASAPPLLLADDPGGTETMPSARTWALSNVAWEPPASTADETIPGEERGFPVSWQRPEPPWPPPRLVDAGLALYGLRSVPFTGRAAERNLIWQALREVAETGAPRVVSLGGASGTGKSSLARWMGERAQELGVAGMIWATHGPTPSPANGLTRMIARDLRCEGLDATEMGGRFADLVASGGVADAAEAEALQRLVAGASTQIAARPREVSSLGPAERHAVLLRHLRHRASERPLILLLEDVQWGADALGFVKHLLARAAEARTPLLLLLTFRTESLAARPAERAMLAELALHPSVRDVKLRPLPTAEHAELVRQLLALDDDLARDVLKRTAGNPLFAVQLIGDWIRRGVLKASTRGFVLRPGERVELPDDLHAAWAGWIAEALRDQPPEAARAVEVAAVLGMEVDEGELRGACAALGIPHAPTLLEALLAADLAEARPGGWAFVHAMLRESLERRATEGGRANALHAACARMLEVQPEVQGLAARVGRHLLGAGRHEEALEPLLRGANDALRQSDYVDADELARMREGALDTLGVPTLDPRRGTDQIVRIRVCIGQGDFAEAEQLAARCAETARKARWSEILLRAQRYRGIAAQMTGNLALAEALFLQAENLAAKLGATDDRAVCMEHRGTLLRMRGEAADSLELLEEALALHGTTGLDQHRADCLKEMGGTLVVLGRPRAAAVLREAIAIYERIGNQAGVAQCLNNLGETLRRAGDLAGAEASYRLSFEVVERLGGQSRIFPLTNLGLVLIARGDYRGARGVLGNALALAQRTRRRSLEGFLHAISLPCAAHARDWTAWDTHIGRAEALLEETGMVDPDVAAMAALAADLADEADEAARAARARKLEVAQRPQEVPPGEE